MASETAEHVTEIIREALGIHGRLIQDIANLVVMSAKAGLDTVDSQAILDTIKKSNEQIIALAERV